MNILLTGGAGFIGSHMVDVLRDAGIAVRVIDNLSGGRESNLAHRASDPDLAFERTDIRSLEPESPVFRGVDYVFHFAGIGDTLRGIYHDAIRMKGDSGAHLIGLLERRLDAVVFRSKFAPTPFAARQLINHGHILVNGKKVNIASFRCKVGDVIEVKEKSKQLALVLESQALAERDVPDYIELDGAKMTAKFARIPALSDVPYAVRMEPHLVVEYYSR